MLIHSKWFIHLYSIACSISILISSHFPPILTTFTLSTSFSNKQVINQSTPHSIECCRAHAACIAKPSGNNVNTESPSTRLQTGQNVTAVFSNEELRKLTNSSLTSNRRTAANCLSISELRLLSSNFVITTSMLSINYIPSTPFAYIVQRNVVRKKPQHLHDVHMATSNRIPRNSLGMIGQHADGEFQTLFAR